jgi:hypothetical protein
VGLKTKNLPEQAVKPACMPAETANELLNKRNKL